MRPVLDEYGVSVGLTESDELLANPTGGRRQGTIFEGLTEVSLGLDLDKMLGLAGGIINISAFQIHGRGLSTNYVDNLNVSSNLEADRSIRLFEWWYQQSSLGGKADVKIGQQSADLEFITTQYGGLFINSGFGFPTLAAVNLPSGGPAYPLGTPAIRFRAKPTDDIAALAGVFNGSPAGSGNGDPQVRNRSGTNFDVSSGVFLIGEVQYALNQEDGATGLPGTYKFGAWYNSNAFTNQFYVNAPISAAAAFANPPRAKHGDYSIYAVMDQLIYRPEGSKDGGAGVFLRAMGSPGEQNVVNVFVDGGVTYRGAFGRDNDTVGLGFAWTRISDTARAGDSRLNAITVGGYPIRNSETLLELSYQAQIVPWLIVQPDFQYVFHPGGGIPNPDQPGKRVGDAAILGVRTSVTF